MEIWHLALYAVGTALALGSLVSLMAHHRQQYERKLRKQAQKEARPTSAADNKQSAENSQPTVKAKPTAA